MAKLECPAFFDGIPRSNADHQIVWSPEIRSAIRREQRQLPVCMRDFRMSEPELFMSLWLFASIKSKHCWLGSGVNSGVMRQTRPQWVCSLGLFGRCAVRLDVLTRTRPSCWGSIIDVRTKCQHIYICYTLYQVVFANVVVLISLSRQRWDPCCLMYTDRMKQNQNSISCKQGFWYEPELSDCPRRTGDTTNYLTQTGRLRQHGYQRRFSARHADNFVLHKLNS